MIFHKNLCSKNVKILKICTQMIFKVSHRESNIIIDIFLKIFKLFCPKNEEDYIRGFIHYRLKGPGGK